MNKTQSATEAFSVLDTHSGIVKKWTIKEILEEINRDRSNEWINYDESDWREGWEEWVEGDYYKLIKNN